MLTATVAVLDEQSLACDDLEGLEGREGVRHPCTCSLTHVIVQRKLMEGHWS